MIRMRRLRDWADLRQKRSRVSETLTCKKVAPHHSRSTMINQINRTRLRQKEILSRPSCLPLQKPSLTKMNKLSFLNKMLSLIKVLVRASIIQTRCLLSIKTIPKKDSKMKKTSNGKSIVSILSLFKFHNPTSMISF